MAIKKVVTDFFGREAELYIRLNSSNVSNHGVDSHFLFRGYESEGHFRDGFPFLWEVECSCKIDVSGHIWGQAYSLIKDESTVDV
ncbi:hypothetical protein KAM449_20830 [Aeromonas caviae]|nr:hypothetical protein KAM374_15610 [Aeromonas caviae]GKQ70560.1 hypothetical protein KAM371_15650 [Aeromonas caviae]GKQ84336.1 hypothetical protein KAM449_20830 [Aeromonas caviae]GKQ93181.1 hypothetical protein KAM451_19470 [Aeromonas caviae]GKR99030.1 hypothetical protein KAM486_12660 [Aeromonas caviae]